MRFSLFFGEQKVIHKILSLVFAAFILNGCSTGEKQPDVSGIQVSLQTQRLDKDIAAIDTAHIATDLLKLREKYPDFLDFYLDTLFNYDVRGNYNDTVAGIRLGLHASLTNKDYRGLLDTVLVHYPDTKKTDEQLTKGFQYLKYYYPQFHVPNVIYIVSWLQNWGAFTVNDNTLAIGLDMFLGEGYPFYKSVGLPDYESTHLSSDYIPVAAFSVIYTGMHPYTDDGRTLLDMMLQRGKQQYFLSKIIPFIDEKTRLGYTEKQLQWCNENEATVYNFFVRENLLYATELHRVARYVNDGPNSTGMPVESPGNIGSWLGYRIVQKYMQEHPQTELEQLFKEQDAQQFLAASKYKPK